MTTYRNRHRGAVMTAGAVGIMGALTPAAFGAVGALGALSSSTTTSTIATTTTTMVSPPTMSACTAEDIGADTGMTLHPDVVCWAGFAMAQHTFPGAPAAPTTGATTIEATGCDGVASCGYADFFHVTTSGWVHDGLYTRECAEDIEIIFISPGAASAFAPVCDPTAWPLAETVQRGSLGTVVMYVQIALVGLGHRIVVNGTFDIDTYFAVQSFQNSNALEANGTVGPETHALLGTGPNPPLPPTTTTTPGPTTTVAVAPGEAPACSAEAITADTDVALAGEPNCAAGWAVIPPLGCGGTDPGSSDVVECEDYDVFHVTHEGWVYDGTVYSGCAWSLAGTGMSEYTALVVSFSCDVAPPERTNIEPESTGEDVTSLQIALVALGYPISVDGTYGPRTQAAVRDFQQRNGLEIDGIAGPDTQEALGI